MKKQRSKKTKEKPIQSTPQPVESSKPVFREEMSFDELVPHFPRLSLLILMMGLVAFVSGYLITVIMTDLVIQYDELVLSGEKWVDNNGKERFRHYYQDFRPYVVKYGPDQVPVESKFTHIGVLGTGIYFYGIINALHWIIEFKLQYLGGLVTVPFIVLLISSVLLNFKVIPSELLTERTLFLSCLFMSIIHALMVILFILVANFISPTFSSLLDTPFHNVGQIFGLLLPSACIILLTNMVYGGIIGGILSTFYPFYILLSKPVSSSG